MYPRNLYISLVPWSFVAGRCRSRLEDQGSRHLKSPVNPNEQDTLTDKNMDMATDHQSNEKRDEADEERETATPFYFESDHTALKGNKDYHNLLRTVALLEAQRTHAIQDLDKLVECRKEAMADPIGFVNKLQHNVDLGLPRPQNVPTLPHIDWENYTTTLGPLKGRHKHMTRNKREAQDTETFLNTGCTQSLEPSASTSNGENSMSTGTSSQFLVRGRFRTDRKPDTFNKLWSADEQKCLEDLLIKFPPEEVEMRRFTKIAQALGNRTTQQVASRVQKYFIKLAKAGLPIPGRMPNINQYMNRKSTHRHQRHNRFLFQPSTFMTSYVPPVYMSDDEEGEDSQSQSGASEQYSTDYMYQDEDISDEEDIPPELRGSSEYMEIMKLKKLKRQKQQEEMGAVQHLGYKCDNCDCEPIIGTRWHCVDCPDATSVDLCDECIDCMVETASHNSGHHLRPVRHPASVPHVDRDYTMFMPGEYNYLDPNYMPAS